MRTKNRSTRKESGLRVLIKNNTPEIKCKLVEYGIIPNTLDSLERPWIAVNYGMFISVDHGFELYNTDHIVCEKDEINLFLGIIAGYLDLPDQYYIEKKGNKEILVKNRPDLEKSTLGILLRNKKQLLE